MKYLPITVKLEKDYAERLKKVCNLNKTQVSTFIREAIFSKLDEGAISNIAGKNEPAYVPEKDNFSWKVKLDDGKEVEIMKDISLEFIEDLVKQLEFQLKKRQEVLRKQDKKSVAVPRRLIK
ncbi:hypothetical protein J4455_00580 [Candidatus Woesearchaeota archaeon]|nr:hypothetical protein [Candidatus Woesearchaeota archaeon]